MHLCENNEKIEQKHICVLVIWRKIMLMKHKYVNETLKKKDLKQENHYVHFGVPATESVCEKI